MLGIEGRKRQLREQDELGAVRGREAHGIQAALEIRGHIPRDFQLHEGELHEVTNTVSHWPGVKLNGQYFFLSVIT